MANRNLEMASQLRLLVPAKVNEDDKLVEYNALLLDRFLDILQDLHGEDLKETVRVAGGEEDFAGVMKVRVASGVEERMHGGDGNRLARHVREAVSKLDGDFVQSLQRDGTRGLIKFCEPLKEVGETVSRAGADATDGQGLDYIGFNSRCNLGLYEADFGWGKPVWVASGGAKRGAEEAPYMNMVLLMDTRSGDGVEAWVCLDEQDMAYIRG
ncbi:hypothetical protein DVH24_020033 [Malus domestica]|uniref:Uncharacterized protein n=1 Tax=Malus domestica TaxID=3750 RepID=A0A498J683_MALDO|nr:hypothetical protein DVH24_020033 [Malus domestica]